MAKADSPNPDTTESRHAFWTTARVMLRYRSQLALMFLGAVLSSACLGAGLGMLLPIMNVLLQEKQSLAQLVHEYIGGGPRGGGGLNDVLGNAIASGIPQDPFLAFVLVIAVVGALTIIGSTGRYLHGLMSITMAQRATMVWRDRLYAHLVTTPLSSTWVNGSADKVSRLMNDTGRLTLGYHAVVARGVLEGTKIIAALTTALLINWKLSLVALLGAPLIGLLTNYFGRKIRKASRGVLQTSASMIGAAVASLSNARVVKVHGAEGFERRRFRRMSREKFKREMDMRQARALASPLNESLSLLAVGVVAIASAWFVLKQGTPASEFIAVMAALIVAGSSIKPFTNLHNEIKESEAAAERVLDAMQAEVEPIAPELRTQYPPINPHHESVVFENVTYRYPGADRLAVQDVSLSIDHGTRVAIVGGNGSGKTTLLSMLPRLLEPTSGRVLIDGTDVSTVNIRSLRDQFGIVTQESVLFEGTIADNIAYGRRWEFRADIEAAAQAAHAHEFISALPAGYDTRLGEDGAGLSGGQRQRLCIARAILRNPAILILDEATSQIDADSEEKINQAIREFSQGRTVLVIAHRLSTVIDADVIVVMDDGRVLDQGRHEELLERCPTYRLLTQTQLHARQKSTTG